MATLTISYDGRNKAARALVEMLRNADFFTVVEPPKRKSGIELALEDVAAGRVTEWHGGIEEMIEHILSEK